MSYDPDKTRLPEDSSGSSSLSAGQQFGQYTVIRQLGRGGMGEVYEVEHPVIDKHYALKLINSAIMQRPEALARFQREARVMANFEHPNIVKVDDFGETDGRTWLRMELVLGFALDESDESRVKSGKFSSLDGLLTGEPLPEALVIDLLKQMLNGLAYAHAQGVVHRDLKPANILLSSTSEKLSVSLAELSGGNIIPKITDFGLVRLAGEQWVQSQVQLTVARSLADPEATRLNDRGSAGTSTQAMLGTFEFMSPEQKQGQEAGPQSDLYAIGLIAFRMLTGEQVLGFEMPSELVPSLGPAWDDWVKRALAPSATRRFESAAEMLERLPSLTLATAPIAEVSQTVTEPEAKVSQPVAQPVRVEVEPQVREQVKGKGRFPVFASVFSMVAVGVVAYFGLADSERSRLELEAERLRTESAEEVQRPEAGEEITSPISDSNRVVDMGGEGVELLPVQRGGIAALEAERGRLVVATVEVQRVLNDYTAFQAAVEAGRHLAEDEQQEKLAPLQAKAVEAVKAIAENQGIDLVFALNSLVYGTNDLDITDAVTVFLNSGSAAFESWAGAHRFPRSIPKVATVNVQKTLNGYAAFQEAVEVVKATVAPVEDEMKKMHANIEVIVTKGRETEAKVKNPALRDEAKAEAQAEIVGLQAQLQAAQDEFQQFREQAQQLAQQGQQEKLAPLQAKAVEAVKAIAENQGIDLVFALNSLIYGSDDSEVTDAVIGYLN